MMSIAKRAAKGREGGYYCVLIGGEEEEERTLEGGVGAGTGVYIVERVVK